MLEFLNNLFDSNDRQLKKIQPIVDEILGLEERYAAMSDEELKACTEDFKKRIDIKEEDSSEVVRAKLVPHIPDIFAAAREASHRVTQHKHFPVQIMAGYFLSQNNIIELFTGEGKTNSSLLPIYLYALTGRGVHTITVNDYLARRDGEWSGHVLNALGVSVSILNNQVQYKFIDDDEALALKGEEVEELIKQREEGQKKAGRLKMDLMEGANLVEVDKREAYSADVVYGTNNEFGFDYLRDNMANNSNDIIQGNLHFAIIDEADSILIDEARTPLIISQSAAPSNDLYMMFASVVNNISEGAHYEIDEKAGSVAITDEGMDVVEKILKVENLYDNPQYAYHLENALKAKEIYKRDDEYIVREGEIVIVDEFTGRAMKGRRYSEGLHQAIEAKEGVEVKQESRTLATVTLQNYFRMYDHLAGMTGTAITEAEEFAKVYGLDTIVVPTNKPIIRKDDQDVVYSTLEAKNKAIVEEIKEVSEKGQPVLVGTASVESSEMLSTMLQKEGVDHQVLNAKYHEKEAKIVQHAGKEGQVTIATNMAGRGTDIALSDRVKELGGLYVLGTERHESRRIDNQLRGRSGRQGDPGRSMFFASFEDELMRKFGGDRMQNILSATGVDPDMPISMSLLGRTIESAQKKVESQNFDIRKRLIDYDDVLNQQRDIIYKLRRGILTLTEEWEKKEFSELSEGQIKELTNVNVNGLYEDLAGFSLYSDFNGLRDLREYELINTPVHAYIIDKLFHYCSSLLATYLASDDEVDISEERNLDAQFEQIMSAELWDKVCEMIGFKSRGEFFKEFQADNAAEKEDLLHKAVLTGYAMHVNEVGYAISTSIARMLILQTIDQYWVNHLEAMADLREGVGMQSMAQRDPLVVYKNEGFSLFEELLGKIDEAVAKRYLRVRIVQRPAGEVSGGQNNQPVTNRGSSGRAAPQRVVLKKKPKRNDPCPCGSGKKYKKCCINKDPSTPEEIEAFKLFFADRTKWDEKYGKK